MADLKDCRNCWHAYRKGLEWLCKAMNTPRPTSFMRDPRNECGLEARLFESKAEKLEEYERKL